ncbi:helix-turn-helix domain-containing protein [Sinorhizobium fredii]|uniref:helix-turn-helix domain-containing protein n=1 Tax=Rhizobium fredii TaxID=380 RepID=UPI003094E715
MSQEATIRRGVRNARYAAIPNHVFEDARLSMEARWLLSYLLSKPDNWTVVIGDIIKKGNCGRDKARKMIAELVECGYAEREQQRDDGKFGSSVLVIFDEPKSFERIGENGGVAFVPQTDLPSTAMPSPVSPSPVKSAHSNNSLPANTDQQDLREGEREAVREENQTETPASVERSFRRWMPTWPTFVGDSVEAARIAWGSLTAEERAEAEARTADYIEAAKAGGRKTICSMAVYLREKRWEKLPVKSAVPQGPKLAGPFGKLWMATRFADLFRKPYGQGLELNPFERRLADKIERLIASGAEPPADLTNMERQMLADGHPVRHLMRDKVLRLGWPLVNEMQARASEAKGYPCPQELMPFAEAFQQVKRDGDLFAAWKAEHGRRGWPFLPEGRLPDWIWFPQLITADGGGFDVSAALEHFHHQISDYLAPRSRGNDDAA